MMVAKWKRASKYSDIEIEYWEPNQPQVETCPHGCNIEISEDSPTKWPRIPGFDAYYQTRFCRQHSFCRIYIITGITAAASNWNPENE
jgi:hypothetical protein